MPKKPDPYALLRPIVAQLTRLTHDELTDLYDMLAADSVTDSRLLPKRHGKPPVNPADGHSLILYGGWQRTPTDITEPARPELRSTYEAIKPLSIEARALIGDMVQALAQANAPVEKRRRKSSGETSARGSIEARYINRNVLNLDTGEVERRAFGPYLYYRYWATGGDHNRRGKRLRNEYIGRQTLAVMFAATEPGSQERRDLEDKIIAARKAGTLDTLMLELGLKPAPADDESGNLRDNQELRNQMD